ncbi:hypothetical protein KR018_000747 [Drosophila ironensis]|nr:hypothetical protein KR018_000747 [Drosophila ironensis]
MSHRVKFQRLAEMKPTMTQFSTVALIVSKSSPNIFVDRLSGAERGVLNLTVRDAVHHVTNCKCWGQRACMEEYAAMLHIGQVVEIVGARVTAHEPYSGGAQPRYQPHSSLPFLLVVNEGSGYVVRRDDAHPEAALALQQLLHRPLKPLGAALKLADFRGSLERASTYADLLVVVAAVRPVRDVKRKLPKTQQQLLGGDLLQCLELVVVDASYPEGMLLSMWQGDWIRRARAWRPLHTILHLVDVRVSYSEYHRCPVLAHAGCTLICEDPQAAGEECRRLREFAGSLPRCSYDGSAPADLDNLPAATTIQAQMTVKQIYCRSEGELADASLGQFTAVLYGLITKFDLDGLCSNIGRKCCLCQRHISRNLEECANDACQMEFSLHFEGKRCHSYFNINIQVSDQTGTLVEARLAGKPAERVLGIQATEFEHLTDGQKSTLKWRYLLKNCETRLLVKKPAGLRKSPVVLVVDMQPVLIETLSKKICVF